MYEFVALIVDPDVASRTRLKEAAHHDISYRHVFTAQTLGQALGRLQIEPFDVVFLSSHFGTERLSLLIQQGRQSEGGRDAAYIILYKAGTESEGAVAQSLLQGADGFLLEPYSVESVVEIAKIAERVKRKNAEARLAAASGLVVSRLMDAIDERAEELARGKRARPFRKEMKNTTKHFKDIDGDARRAFLGTAINLFTNVLAPRFTTSRYRGASKRVREKLGRERRADRTEHTSDAALAEAGTAEAGPAEPGREEIGSALKKAE